MEHSIPPLRSTGRPTTPGRPSNTVPTVIDHQEPRITPECPPRTIPNLNYNLYKRKSFTLVRHRTRAPRTTVRRTRPLLSNLPGFVPDRVGSTGRPRLGSTYPRRKDHRHGARDNIRRAPFGAQCVRGTGTHEKERVEQLHIPRPFAFSLNT